MNNTEIIEVLSEFGLSEQEVSVYIKLIELGGASATQLATEMGLKRTTAYPLLERLISHGVVIASDQGSKKFFTPIRPNKLTSLYENKLNSLTKIIPALERMQGQELKEYGVRMIKSKREFEAFYSNILDEYRDREYYIIGSVAGFLNIDRDFLISFRKKRASRNTRVKLLLSHDSRAEEGQGDPKLLRSFKYLPEKYNFKSTIDIYDDKIVIIGPEVKALAVVVAIPAMVDIFRSVFEILWEGTA